jgi:hypothetical protein
VWILIKELVKICEDYLKMLDSGMALGCVDDPRAIALFGELSEQ